MEIATLQKGQLETFAASLNVLTQSNEQKLEKVREAVEAKLAAIQLDNTVKLEQMRATVDEKLHATLEQRLGESFKIVSERLELVHKGLGEMQSLANGVGDLKGADEREDARQLGGGATRQLARADAHTRSIRGQRPDESPGAGARRVRRETPGRDGTGAPVWLPIDAKFPQEDYQRLVAAADQGDADGVAVASARWKSESAKRPKRSRRNTSTRLTRPTSGFSSCRPKGFSPKCFAGRGSAMDCCIRTASSWPGRPPWPPC